MHYFIGDLGHLFVITSFILALVTSFAYFKATTISDLAVKERWLWNGRIGFYLHAASVLGNLRYLICHYSNHYFEYHYAYNYSDRKLPILLSNFNILEWSGGKFFIMDVLAWRSRYYPDSH